VSLFTELKRRKVFRVAVVYAATAFVVLQVADIMLPRLGVPEWAMSFIVLLVALGFPVALVLAWALELTPDGIRVTPAPTTGDPAQPPPSLLGKRTLMIAGTLVVLGVGLGAGWLLKPGTAAPAPLAGSAPRIPGSVAVLPFDNFAVEDEDYFSDGITEDIIAQLTRVPDLTVVSRTSAMRYRNTELTVRQIGAELGVGAILEGSVRRAGGRVRIVAQLIDVATDRHLWAETYDRDVADIFAVQSEVAREIAAALGRTLGSAAPSGAGRERARTDPETYELYLRGRHLWNQRRPAALRSAIQYFEAAIARDPAFALAHAGLADVYVVLPFSDPTAPAQPSAESAMYAARRALELDPTLGEAYAALGQASMVAWSFEDAERYFARALDLTPGYATAHHWAGAFRLALGRYEEAVPLVGRALELDPFAPRFHQALATFLLMSGRQEEALQVLARGAELEPGYQDYHVNVLLLYAYAGDEDRAFGSLLRAHALSPASGLSPDALRAAFHDAGLHGAIRLVLERAPAVFHSNFRRADAELFIGDREAALRSLERTVDGREAYSPWIGAMLGARAIEHDPRYRALLRRVGVPRVQ
jgi:TolB-like protein/tetratricopeptide (TPR) repeat protein